MCLKWKMELSIWVSLGLLDNMHLFQNAHSKYFYYKNYTGMVGIFLKKHNDIIHLLWQRGSRPAHAEERY